MNFKKKIVIISTLLISLTLTGVATAVYNFQGNGDESDGAGGKVDTFTLENNSVTLYDNISDDYLVDNKRFYLGSDTLFDTEHYGEYRIKTGTELVAYKDTIRNPLCIDSVVSYTFSGTLNSPWWGDLEIQGLNTNYYCPRSKNLSLPFDYLVTGPMLIEFNPAEVEVTLEDVYGNTQTGVLANVFDNKKLSLNGSYVGKGESLTGELSESLDIIYGEEILTESNKFQFNKNVNKNISNITRNMTAEGGNSLNSLAAKDIFYYNYEGTSDGTASHIQNYGKIVTLGSGGAVSTYDEIEVDGGKTIIVKGGNIYINADIYNADNDSLLVIAAKRDYSDRENGGNIYISPDVTNIDAILIADGSILNFDGADVLSIEDGDATQLRRQLLVYGSVFTSNTIGENINVYGTDDFIANSATQKNKYNLENLRTFQPVLSSGLDLLDTCYDIDNKAVAFGASSTGSLEYAFAGKKHCYIEDAKLSSNLRGTDSFASVVIRYNPKLADSDIKILYINN